MVDSGSALADVGAVGGPIESNGRLGGPRLQTWGMRFTGTNDVPQI